MEIPNKKLLSRIFNILSSESRLRALELFEQSRKLNEIAELSGMSRSGFQKVVDSFRELGIIERAGHRSRYKLSRKGRKILSLVRDFGERLEPIEKEIAMEKIKTVVYGSGLTKEDIAKLLKELEREGEDD
ncbi:MAG: hypothetical protein DRJ38_03415 [Thermoprotei archaeon]|nr:MAG: hypothetical protein DRJ38_03415 [Thermoprotei archaeon]